MRVVAPWMGFVDKPGGRKIHVNPKLLGGGVAIFWSLALPILAGLAYVHCYLPLLLVMLAVMVSPKAGNAINESLVVYKANPTAVVGGCNP